MKKTRPRFRFMAMSKLIGLIAFAFISIITLYTMKEMHDTGNYEALPQLIISAFGFAGIYAGFYLTMAKVEHVEEEKTKREKELLTLQKKQASEEEIAEKKQQIESLMQDVSEMIKDTTQNLM